MARARAEGSFSVDLTEFPLVYLRSPSASAYERLDVASFFACIERATAQGGPCAILHDVRDLPYLDDARRTLFLHELRRRRPRVLRRLVAYAAVTSSPLERGLITGLAWYANLPLPTRLFASEADARAFLCERLAHAAPGEALRAVRPPDQMILRSSTS